MNTQFAFELNNARQFNDQKRLFLLNAKPSVIIAHLLDSHKRYEHEIIPMIERDFLALIKLVPHPSLSVIFNLFLKFQMEMKLHMEIEEQKIYPAYLAKQKPKQMSHATDALHSHEDSEPFLHEVIQLLEKSSFSKNPFCQILLRRMKQFEAELIEHAWIEDNVLEMHH